MSGTQSIIKELKKQLKLHDIHYQDIAIKLDLSEGSVKRLLADGNNISLARLSAICELISMDICELVKLAANAEKNLQSLTFEQEQQIVSDKALLMVSVCVLNGFQLNEIIERYNINKQLLMQKLIELDRIGVLELMPDNRIRLLLSPNFDWIAGGPIQTFFLTQVLPEFFQSHFSRQDEKLLMSTGLMSPHTNQKFQLRLQKLVEEFYSACHGDNELDMSDRNGTSLIIALRRWHFDMFDNIDYINPK